MFTISVVEERNVSLLGFAYRTRFCLHSAIDMHGMLHSQILRKPET